MALLPRLTIRVGLGRKSGLAPSDVGESSDHKELRVAASERQRELRRRRQRKKKLGLLKRRCEKASASQKAAVAETIRRLTPGAETIIKNWGLED